MWAQTRKGLELLPPAQCHVPQEGRTLEEDLEDIVLAKNTEIWSELKSQGMDLKIGDTRLYNMPSTIRKKMGFAVQAASGTGCPAALLSVPQTARPRRHTPGRRPSQSAPQQRIARSTTSRPAASLRQCTCC